VVVAHIAEQTFWGRELARIGVAPAPLTRGRLSASSLAGRISAVLKSREMHHRASAVGERMGREHGVGTAVSLINRKFQVS
jgi:sterol 3beta-glucosyltransferase